MSNLEYLEDLEIARVLLYKKANRCLEFHMLHPEVLLNIVKDFLTTGCKSHNDYKFMINELFKHDYWSRQLLLEN